MHTKIHPASLPIRAGPDEPLVKPLPHHRIVGAAVAEEDVVAIRGARGPGHGGMGRGWRSRAIHRQNGNQPYTLGLPVHAWTNAKRERTAPPPAVPQTAVGGKGDEFRQGRHPRKRLTCETAVLLDIGRRN